MNNQHKKLVNIALWCAIILFIIRCCICWDELLQEPSFYELYGFASEAIGVAIFLTLTYEKIIWRINPLDKTPKLSKKYVGTLKSTYDNKEREAKLEIKQTLTSIHIVMTTEESKSRSVSASLEEILGEMQLTYCYINEPKSEVRHRSQIHYGTAIFAITNPKVINGKYYTDRKTVGDMYFFAKK